MAHLLGSNRSCNEYEFHAYLSLRAVIDSRWKKHIDLSHHDESNQSWSPRNGILSQILSLMNPSVSRAPKFGDSFLLFFFDDSTKLSQAGELWAQNQICGQYAPNAQPMGLLKSVFGLYQLPFSPHKEDVCSAKAAFSCWSLMQSMFQLRKSSPKGENHHHH